MKEIRDQGGKRGSVSIKGAQCAPLIEAALHCTAHCSGYQRIMGYSGLAELHAFSSH